MLEDFSEMNLEMQDSGDFTKVFYRQMSLIFRCRFGKFRSNLPTAMHMAKLTRSAAHILIEERQLWGMPSSKRIQLILTPSCTFFYCFLTDIFLVLWNLR